MKVTKLEDEFNSCLILFEVLGQQYFSLKSLQESNVQTRPSVFRLIHMIFLVLLIPVLMIFYILQEHSYLQESLNAKNILMYVIKNSMNVGMVLVACTSLIQSYISTEKTKKIYMNLRENVQSYINDFNQTINFRMIRNAAFKRLSVMVIFFVVVHGGITLLNLHSMDAVIKLTIGLLPMFFLLTIMNKYIFYVGMVNHQLQYLATLMGDILKADPHPVKIIVDIVNNGLKPMPIKLPEDPMRKLRAARKIYNIIFENGTLINESNGLTILVMLISLVIALTVSGYEVFVIIIGGLPWNRAMGT